MLSSIATLLVASAATVSASPLQKVARGGSQSVSITPHEQYSSSVGVLGCKINTNRVAYWPGSVDCDKICVKVTHAGRSVHLLKIDSSGGAHDISYDAWNYLVTGESATSDPQSGGGVAMDYEFVDADECKDLLHDGKLPLSAPTGSALAVSCPADSWVGKNYELINLYDQSCHMGWDEKCTYDSTTQQITCPHTLGGQKTGGTGLSITNIQYGTGKKVSA
jgi:hypothetical protein